MQVLITHGNVARTRVYRFSRWQLFAGALIGLTTMLVLSATVYHLVFLKAAREGWPVVSQIVKLLWEVGRIPSFHRKLLCYGGRAYDGAMLAAGAADALDQLYVDWNYKTCALQKNGV